MYTVEDLAGELTAGWSCAQVSALLGEAAMVACLEGEEAAEVGGEGGIAPAFSTIAKTHLDQALVALCKQRQPLPNHYA